MRKINGIVTINDISNYGNRLQNYAMQQLLKKYGESYTIDLRVNVSTAPQYVRSFLRRPKLRIGNGLKAILPCSGKIAAQRILSQLRFTERYVPDDKLSLTAYRGLRGRRGSRLRTVVIGSDQVWNDRWLSSDDLALRLGSFVAEGHCISYAASFGVSEVKEESKPLFRKYLPRLRAISVREFRAAEMVRELADCDATVVLDPTLMLPAEQWRKIMRQFVPENDRYVLTYFLGKPDEAQGRTIQEYAREHGCRVRCILDMLDTETYVAGPEDFVELFSKAEYVFTDSYHACCFSLLFHKQFTVFNRADMDGKANMNSRMETLFRLFDLQASVRNAGLADPIDYDKVDVLLSQHRQESQTWLDAAMEGNATI